MIELRWLVPDGTTTEPPRLQYRVDGLDVERGHVWEEWQDVPRVVALPAAPQAEGAPTP